MRRRIPRLKTPKPKPIKPWNDWSGTEQRSWYYGGKIGSRKFGNLWFHGISACVYIIVSVLVPAILLLREGTPKAAVETLFGLGGDCPWRFLLGLIWLGTVTLGLPGFIWLERLSFDDWVQQFGQADRERLTARFELNTKHMEAFWKTVAGLYVAGGLLSFSNLGGGNDDAKVQALANATTTLLFANKLGDSGPPTPETQEAIEALTVAVKTMTASLAQKPPASGDEGAQPKPPPVAKGSDSPKETQGSAPPGSADSQEQ